MYFTSGSDRAFEQLMQGKPGFDHYDSGEAVTPEDCGTCRFYRPHWKYQFCVYAECPYQPGKLTAYDAVTFRVKGVENMAVFRVERNKGYTVMSNHHLRNKDLSLKAKGLLSQMLSLPEDWDYTLKGLSLINREQIDAIRAAIRELEQAGYIVRSRERDSQGRLRGADYVIYEQPQPVPDSPTLENPMLDNPTQEKPTLGKPTQLNKDISSKEKTTTDVSITDSIPTTEGMSDVEKGSFEKSLNYMGFSAGESLIGKPIDYVFLGACTNGRIEDFRAFASIVKGRKKAENVVAWLVPGSWMVDEQIRQEGLDKVLEEAGFAIRQPGCSACLAMNDDKIPAGKYSVSTSNRNFEGRQGPGARTLLASPLTAAAAAVTGVITDPRTLM